MPTYQYSCTECGHFLEQFQSFTDDALTECPVCGGRLRKVFNAVGVVFKGSGFYRNDSRSPEGAGKSEQKSDGGDAKPASDKPAAKDGAGAASTTPEKKTSTPEKKSSSGAAAAS